MDKRVLYVTLFVAFCMALFASSQQAPILIPEWYDGVAHLDGEIAPEGTKIEAKTLNGEVVGSGLVHNDRGQYTLLEGVVFDNDFMDGADDGAAPGEALEWYINGVLAYQPEPGSDIAESGGFNQNYDLYARSDAKTATASGSVGRMIMPAVAVILAFLFFEAVFLFLGKKKRA